MDRGLLPPRVAGVEPAWLFADDEDVPAPPEGYVVSFAHFHERGFGTPASKFFRGLLHYYGIKLQNLNPNSILQVAVFVTLCKGYLGIDPNFALWKYFFYASVFLKTVKKGVTAPVRMGGVMFQLRSYRAAEYITIKAAPSHKGWHQKWFYVRSYPDAPLPPFTGRYFEVAPKKWEWGPVDAEKKKIGGLLDAIKTLKNHDLIGAGVVAAFHRRRVLPLMRRERSLSEMVPGARIEGTALSAEVLPDPEVMRRIREGLGSVPPVHILDECPPMRPDPGFVELVSIPYFSVFIYPPSSIV